MNPKMYILSGCNGAGKTTASQYLLPNIFNNSEFVNADIIAHEISPDNPDSAAIEAGRRMLRRIDDLIDFRRNFTLETTLSTLYYRKIIEKAKDNGYEVTLMYFWLNSPLLAIECVAERVRRGEHNIPPDVIRRRYVRGIKNLFNIFIPICDCWRIDDNS